MKREYRYLQEVRLGGEESKPVISGYAAIFDSPATIGERFVEVVRPGAFTRALKQEQDVRALQDHDPSRIVGRTKNGTLRLAEDERGLRVEIDPPNTTVGNDLVENLRRGDVDSMSFGFSVKDAGQRWSTRDGKPHRELLDVDLFDVSVVTYPAYDQTSVSVRSMFPDGEPEIPAVEEPPVVDTKAEDEERERLMLRLRIAELE